MTPMWCLRCKRINTVWDAHIRGIQLYELRFTCLDWNQKGKGEEIYVIILIENLLKPTACHSALLQGFRIHHKLIYQVAVYINLQMQIDQSVYVLFLSLFTNNNDNRLW